MQFEKLTYEQRTLFAAVRALVGANPTYIDLYFQGVIAAHEILTYDAKKLYIAFEFTAVYHTANSGTFEQLVTYNQANAVNMYFNASAPFWNTTGASPNLYTRSDLWHNFWFSRVVVGNYDYFKMNGIKVTWP